MSVSPSFCALALLCVTLRASASQGPGPLPGFDSHNDDPQTCKHVTELDNPSSSQLPSMFLHMQGAWGVLRHIFGATRCSLLLMFLCTMFMIVYYATHIDAWPLRCQRLLARLLRVPSTQLEKEKLSEIVKYRLDVYVFSRSDSKLLLLSFLTASLIAFGGVSLYIVSGEGPDEAEEAEKQEAHHGKEEGASLGEALWAAAAGAGLSWDFFPATSYTARFTSLLIALGGTLVTALLLGIVSDVLHNKVDELKNGHGAVLESGHMLILGWSDKVFTVLEELAEGCSMLGGCTIVILSDKGKEDMQEAIAEHDIDFKNNRLMLRQGCILSVAELRKVSAQHARTILILADQKNPCSDARTLRCMTCLQHPSLAPPTGGKQAQVIAELCVTNQEELLLQVSGGPHVRTICSMRLTARLIVQCIRYPQLRDVLFEMLGFSGSEIYVAEATEALEGLPFQYLQAAYENAVPMGLCKARNDMSIELNPPSGVVEKGDQVILLADDADCLSPYEEGIREALHLKDSIIQGIDKTSELQAASSMASVGESGSKFGGRFLIVGWRKNMVFLISQLDSFCTQTSELYLYSDIPISERQQLLEKGGMKFSLQEGEYRPLSLKHLRLHFSEPWLLGDSTAKADLQALCPLQFTNIVVLAQDSLGTDTVDTDSRTVSCLLNLRQIQIEGLRSSGVASEGSQAIAPNSRTDHDTSNASELPCTQYNRANLLSIASRLKAWERRQMQIGMNPHLQSTWDAGDEHCYYQSQELASSSNEQHEQDEKERERRAHQEAQFQELQVWCAQLLRSVIACKQALQDQDDKGRERQLHELQTVLQKSSIVSELLDSSKNIHSLDLSTRVFPNEIVAQLMALTMLSFERLDILNQLFHPGGNKFYVRPALWLLSDEDATKPMTFVSLYQKANKKGDVLLGYVDADGVVKLNPQGKAVANLTLNSVESFVTISCDVM